MDQGHTWFRDLEGRIFNLKEINMSVKIEKQLTEVTDPRMAQRHVLTHARVQETGSSVMVKVRYDLKPQQFLIEDVEKKKAIVDRHIDWEIDILNQLADIGHGPEHIHTVRYKQGETGAYPGGYTFIMVMKQVPGEDVEKIKNQLSNDQLYSIRKQLAYILNELAQEDVTIDEQHPSFLRYDRENDKLYLVDLTHWWYHDIGEEIGMNSAYVMAFGLCKDLVADEQEYPWKVAQVVEEEGLIEEGGREPPRPAGSLRHYSSRNLVENQLMSPGSRVSPRRPGLRTPMSVMSQPMLHRSREAGPQGPQESPSGAVEVLSDLLQAATMGEMSEITGRGGRGGRGGGGLSS